MEMQCILCKWHTKHTSTSGILYIYTNNLLNNSFSHEKSWNTQTNTNFTFQSVSALDFLVWTRPTLWWVCLHRILGYMLWKVGPMSCLKPKGHMLLDDLVLHIPALSGHPVTPLLWLAWTGCTSASVKWSCTGCMHWTVSCQRERRSYKPSDSSTGEGRMHTASPLCPPLHPPRPHPIPLLQSRTGFGFMTHSRVFLLIFPVSTMPKLSCIAVRMETDFLSCHFTAIILWLYMAIASPFSSFHFFSSSDTFFLLSLTVPKQHSCLHLTGSQSESETNTNCLYTSCNLWIGREPSISPQQPHVKGGSDPQHSAHCIF